MSNTTVQYTVPEVDYDNRFIPTEGFGLYVDKVRESNPAYFRSLAEVISIAEEINRLGGQTYILGGTVRGMLLGEIPSDIDIRIVGVPLDRVKTFLEERKLRFETPIQHTVSIIKDSRFHIDATVYDIPTDDA